MDLWVWASLCLCQHCFCRQDGISKQIIKNDCLKDNITNTTIPNKGRRHCCEIKVKYFVSAIHRTCGNKKSLMVLGIFLNVFGIGDNFVDKDN